MDFNTLEKEIEQLNRINTKANYTSRDRFTAGIILSTRP